MGDGLQIREVDSGRLDSWKEIAAFLHRDARTVRRWERERGLPVHRVPGGERSGVFAYTAELERWLHATESPIHDPANPEAGALVSVEAAPGQTPASESDHGTSQIDPTSSHSALHSINTMEGGFAAACHIISDESCGSVFTHPDLQVAALGSRSLNSLSAVRVALLLLFVAASIGVPMLLVHQHNSRAAASSMYQPSAEAEDLYLRGRYNWNLRTEAGLNVAVDLFTQAIVTDPHYAVAYSGLADSYLLLSQYGHMSHAEAFPRALAAARQSVALDGSCPGAHRSLAFILRFWNWDMPAAEKEFQRAIALNPNDSQSHHWYATALLSSGRYQDALRQIDLARALEPQSVSVLADRGLILSMMDARAGITALNQLEQAQPDFISIHTYLSGIYLDQSNYPGYLSEIRRIAQLRSDQVTVTLVDRAQKLLVARGPRPMLREMASSFAPQAESGSFPAYNAARLFGLAGEQNQAMHFLQLACEHREPNFLSFERDAAFSPLRGSREYHLLLSRREASLPLLKQPIAQLDMKAAF